MIIFCGEMLMIFKNIWSKAVLALFAGTTLLNGAEIKAPELKFSGKAGSIMAAPGSFYSDFKVLGTNKTAPVQTFYKVYHDQKNLYVAIKAMEPNPERMTRRELPTDSEQMWRNDTVELNFIHTGDETRLYKLIVDTNGVVTDASGEDDNTGLSKFALDYAFSSYAKVISLQINKDCWTLELAIPLGVS